MVEEQRSVDKQQLVNIDLEGNSKSSENKGIKLKKLGEHKGKIVSLKLEESYIYNFTTTPPVKTNEKENKLVFKVQVLDEGNVEIPLFVKPKINRITTLGFSNSKLYDILDLAGVLDSVSERKEELKVLGNLLMFLEEKLVGKSIRFASKNSRKGKPDEYSVVGEIYEFLNNESEVKAEVNHQESSQ